MYPLCRWGRLLAAMAIFLLVTHLAPAAEPPSELRKLHALLVIDTNADLGDLVTIDGHRIEVILRNGVPSDRLELTVFKGKDVTSERILAYYHQLKAAPHDALLFYATCHGAIDPKKGHWLTLQNARTDGLLRADLRKAMEEKKAGLTVLLTDCCSARCSIVPEDAREVLPRALPGKVKEVNPVLSCLFLRHRGIVDVTAADDNTIAFGDDGDGSLFTRSLTKLLRARLADLDANKDGFVSWTEFFPRVQADTEKVSVLWIKKAREEPSSDIPKEQKRQRPRVFELPGDAASLTLTNGSKQLVHYEFRWTGDKDWSKGTLAAAGTQLHRVPAAFTGKESPVLEVKFENGDEAKLKPGKTYRFTPDKKP